MADKQKDDEPKTVRTTFGLPSDLVEEMRDAVVYLQGKTRITLSAFIKEAIRRELDRLSTKHHGGRRFPRRSKELHAGRPIDS